MTLSQPNEPLANFSGSLGEPRYYAGHNDVQSTIDSHAASSSDYEMTTVSLSPDAGTYDDRAVNFPLTVPTGVHLDLNGMTLKTSNDTDMVLLQPGSALTYGKLDYTPAGDGYSSSGIHLDDSTWDRDATPDDPIYVADIWGRGHPYCNGTTIHVNLQNGHSVDKGLMIDRWRFYRCGKHQLHVEVGDSSSAFSNNMIRSAFTHSSIDRNINLHSQVSGGRINNNHFNGIYHPQGGDSDWLAHLHGYEVQGNDFYLTPMWDQQKFNDGLFWFEESTAGGVINNHVYSTNHIPVKDVGWINHDVASWHDQTANKQNAYTNWLRGPDLEFGNYNN